MTSMIYLTENQFKLQHINEVITYMAPLINLLKSGVNGVLPVYH